MSKYKAYPEYKDSGVEWLGEVPAHWITSKFGYLKTVLTDYTANGSFADLKSNVIYLDEPSYARLVRLTDLRHDLNNSNGVWIDESSYKYLSKSSLYGGEFLLANVGAYAGLFYQMPYNKGAASLAPNMFMAKFSVDKVLARFIAYVGQADNISKQLTLKATASSAQPKLNKDDFKSIFCCYPPLNDQSTISAFLDHETAKIDNLIEKQQQLIELLKEKRQAVISHAVTKGLNPDVPMKNSGVEWLGEVPEHWDVHCLKHLISSLDSGCSVNAADMPAQKGEIGVLKTSCVYTRSFRPNENKTVVLEDLHRVKCPVEKGSIIISRMNTPDLVGASALVDIDVKDVYLPDRLWQTIFNKNLELIPAYLAHFMTIKGFRTQISLAAEGASSSMQNIAKEDYLAINCLLPSFEEQKEITKYLEDKLSYFTNLELKSFEIVYLLQERRTALISAAVTGKIDVRDWVAPDTSDIEASEEATA